MRQLLKSKQNLFGKIMQDPGRKAWFRQYENIKWRVRFFNVVDLKWEPYSGTIEKEYFFMI